MATQHQTSEEKFNEIKANIESKQRTSTKQTQAELIVEAETTLVQLPSHASHFNKIELSPYDLSSLGRSIPMLWCYSDNLDTDKLISSLTKLLLFHPVLCGRYDGTTPPKWLVCNNAGVPVRVTTWNDTNATVQVACQHLPTTSAFTTFPLHQHAPFVPDKQDMDPDTMSPAAPLFKVKITCFPKGGTSIGVLVQHGVLDAEAIIALMCNWSRVYRGMGLDPIPNHNRCSSLCALEKGSMTPSTDASNEWSSTSTFHSVPVAEKQPPEFVGQMPTIMGNPAECVAGVVPVKQTLLSEWKEAANEHLSNGLYCSTDDILTARTWQALTTMRVGQLGIAADSAQTTTLSRAFNVRTRTAPPLGPCYFGNATTGVRTSMSVKDLLKSTPADIALRLRADINHTTPEMIAVRATWLTEQYAKGNAVTPVYDDKALTFIVSSWNFSWEQVEFDSVPISYDHGCIVPIVAVIVPRKVQEGGGMQVYVSGPNEEDMAIFAERVLG